MKNNFLQKKVIETYNQHFGGEFLLVQSPGRVNIIGEHTDYNNGFVLPAAINKIACVAIGKSHNKVIQLHAAAFQQNYQSSVEQLLPAKEGWPNYILGVADQMIKSGYELGGFNLVIDADIPPGSGMSSSAAVECATAIALNELFNLNISGLALAEMSQKAEHSFVGVQCGIMDQFASVFSKKNHVIKLDCRSLEYELIPLELQHYKIVLLNTNVHHSLANSEYNARRRQCEDGVSILKKIFPSVQSLRDVEEYMLKELIHQPELYKRCSYVVEENTRLLQACEHLQKGNLKMLGQLMFESHDGLSNKYEVSCKELDFLVDKVRNNPAVLGARMMGGGFGGCTINLMEETAINEITEMVSEQYLTETGKTTTVYIAETADGGKVIQDLSKI